MAVFVKNLVLRGNPVAGDESVNPVLGFAPAGKTPESYPLLPQAFPPAVVQPAWRPAHTERIRMERVVRRAGRLERSRSASAGALVSRSLASIARQAVQFGWPAADGQVQDSSSWDQTHATETGTATPPLALALPGLVPAKHSRDCAGRDKRLALCRQFAGQGMSSVATRGPSADGTRIPPRADD